MCYYLVKTGMWSVTIRKRLSFLTSFFVILRPLVSETIIVGAGSVWSMILNCATFVGLLNSEKLAMEV
jgi:hypothetical protein